jgi:alkanesulfonate monooxygenase SsuD/methylene tetrahydromethanopterin reductase-like flavin-dependent oxidoreductase (luciferase family)
MMAAPVRPLRRGAHTVDLVEFFANLAAAVPDPASWARQREDEGFHGVACSDHFWLSGRTVNPFPHLWVTLAAMSGATSRARLQPAFANNLFRHPVEFAQASLAMQAVSGGRYEAGLGAGWLRDEMDRTGQSYPDGRTRARMYAEALQIVRELLAGRPCAFQGEHYTVDVPALGPVSASPPPLVGSVGSPWTMRHVTPLLDRVELKMGRTTRGGGLDLPALGTVTSDEVRGMVDAVRSAKPGIAVSLLAFVGCGEGASMFQRLLGDGLYGGFVGDPEPVAERLHALADLGFDRVQLSEWLPGSLTAVAVHL